MINANKDLFTKEEDNPDSTANQLADKALKRITGQRVEGEVSSYLAVFTVHLNFLLHQTFIHACFGCNMLQSLLALYFAL